MFYQKKRKEIFPVRNQTFKGWGEIEDEFTINPTVPATGPAQDSCGARGACIDTLLFPEHDLSGIERHRLAEHVSTCSACAARRRLYQRIDEIAPTLPRYDLALRGKKPVQRTKESKNGLPSTFPSQRGNVYTQRQRHLIKVLSVFALLYLILFTLWLFIGISKVLFWTAIGGTLALGAVGVYWRTQGGAVRGQRKSHERSTLQQHSLCERRRRHRLKT
jgi:hypothetical protein